MKKLLIIALFSVLGILAYSTCQAQTISFCKSVKENGEMVSPSPTFGIPKQGGVIYMLVNLEKKVDAEKIVYKVFKVSNEGDQTLDQTLNDIVKPEWLWFDHELIIRSPGNYIVYVYKDGSLESLASGMVHVIMAKK
jgi:hypothetical protein